MAPFYHRMTQTKLCVHFCVLLLCQAAASTLVRTAQHVAMTEGEGIPDLPLDRLHKLFTEHSEGKHALLYLDYSDFASDSAVPHDKRQVRSKYAEGVLAGENSGMIFVTESAGSLHQTYQMIHPALAANNEYNLPANASLLQDRNGLSVVEAILESAAYEHLKLDCQTWKNNAGSEVQLDSPSSDDHHNFERLELSQSAREAALFKGCSSAAKADACLPGSRLAGSSYCGVGQKPASESLTGSTRCYGENYCLLNAGDWACRRHDACDKFVSMGAGPDISGCSCDYDIYTATKPNGNGISRAVALLFSTHGLMPCLHHEYECTTRGRRRRWKGEVMLSTCKKIVLKWKYSNKRGRTFEQYGYRPCPGDVHSEENWPGCEENTVDAPGGDFFNHMR